MCIYTHLKQCKRGMGSTWSLGRPLEAYPKTDLGTSLWCFLTGLQGETQLVAQLPRHKDNIACVSCMLVCVFSKGHVAIYNEQNL